MSRVVLRHLCLLAALASPSLSQVVLNVPNGTGREALGTSVAVDGDTLIAGAPGDTPQGTGLSAYVYERVGSTWSIQAQLIGSDSAPGDEFGFSVDLENDLAVIGAPRATVAGPNSGAAYVFERSGQVWSQVAKLTAADGSMGDRFGFSVSLSGTRVVVGAPRNNVIQTDSGAAYVFDRVGSSWVQTQQLNPADGGLRHLFGTAVDVESDRLIVGATKAAGAVDNSGAVYVYELGTVWTLQQKVFASSGASGDFLGRSVALEGDLFVAGAPGDDRNVSGVGKAFAFELRNSTWEEVDSLADDDPVGGSRLGTSIALDSGLAFVGAPTPARRGKVLGFGQNDDSWAAQHRLQPMIPARVEFGASVSVDGSTVVVGAPGRDSLGTDSGEVRVFRIVPRDTKIAFVEATLRAAPQLADHRFGHSLDIDGDVAVVAEASGFPTAPATTFAFRRTAEGEWSAPIPITQVTNPRVSVSGDTIAVSASGQVEVFVDTGTTWASQGTLVATGPVVVAGDVFVTWTGNDYTVHRRTGTTWALDHVEVTPELITGLDTDGSIVVRTSADLTRVYSLGAGSSTEIGSPLPFGTGINIGVGPRVSLSGDDVAIVDRPGSQRLIRIVTGISSGAPTVQDTLTFMGPAGFGVNVALTGDMLATANALIVTSNVRTYFRSGDQWQFGAELSPLQPEDREVFGRPLAADGDHVLASSSFASSQQGVSAVGLATVFRVSRPAANYCTGKVNSLGCVPFMSSHGTVSASDPNPAAVVGQDMIPGNPGSLTYGFQGAETDFHGGKLCIRAPVQTIHPPVLAKATGKAPCTGTLALDFNAYVQSGADPLLTAGSDVYLQWTQRDPSDPAGFLDSLTNGLSLRICP